jgi:translation initiation factor 1 (eIF-1/SUI1)
VRARDSTAAGDGRGRVIQLQGDLRRQVYEALWTWQICDRDMIKVSRA